MGVCTFYITDTARLSINYSAVLMRKYEGYTQVFTINGNVSVYMKEKLRSELKDGQSVSKRSPRMLSHTVKQNTFIYRYVHT